MHQEYGKKETKLEMNKAKKILNAQGLTMQESKRCTWNKVNQDCLAYSGRLVASGLNNSL